MSRQESLSSFAGGANSLKDAHAALDTAILTAYGFSARKDLLAQLLALNQEVAAKIKKGEPVTAPGVPKNYPDAKKLVTGDCIRPTKQKAPWLTQTGKTLEQQQTLRLVL